MKFKKNAFLYRKFIRPAPHFLIFGNALVDKTIKMEKYDEKLLKKFKIEKNSQVEMDLEQINLIFNEARKK